MNSEYDQVIRAARKVRNCSYSPYSKFAVGAAVRVGSGHIFSGTNVENVSFGLALCAERAALAAAVAGGERDIDVLGLVANSTKPVVPCGACRQVLAEFNPSLIVVSETLTGERTIESLEDLLPLPRRGILEDAGS